MSPSRDNYSESAGAWSGDMFGPYKIRDPPGVFLNLYYMCTGNECNMITDGYFYPKYPPGSSDQTFVEPVHTWY